MRIQQLLYLQKVVALGNMTEAAKELFIAQPTLSSQQAAGKKWGSPS